ncbi:MAG: VWA domain-containing protein [Cyanothece sp. SIO2G6]|nr:VWA domain-containing protein [Cyanothece sp. SIO2G6]
MKSTEFVSNTASSKPQPNSSQTATLKPYWAGLVLGVGLGLLTACDSSSPTDPGIDGTPPVGSGFEVKVLVGSALGHFCEDAIAPFNQSNPTLADGSAFYASCEALGSGDVVDTVLTLAEQLQQGTVQANDPRFPVLLSVDGEIYHSQMKYRIEQLFPGETYIPEITDAPLLATSPMVFMTQEDLAPGLQNTPSIFQAFIGADTHQDIDPNSPALTIHYVHTAPTRSNSGLQTLVTQFAEVSGKRPEELTTDDVATFIPQVAEIQEKITRYGTSTSSLAKTMVQNGPFWASVGSVYESSVIAANQTVQPGQPRYKAVYPPATFTSNMRAIVADAPWNSAEEKEAAAQIIEYLRSPQAQDIATRLGLRPGTPGIPLSASFSPEFGVDPNANYDSYRPPQPEVVEAMLTAWENVAKKSSLVVVVVDSSGSMQGNKLPAVQNTLQTYINNLGERDRIALIDFDTEIRPPVLIEGTSEGRNIGLQFISSLEAEGGTQLYDATLYARNWLQDNLRSGAINAVLVLTDGVDSGEGITLESLSQQLQSSGFESDQRIAVFTIGYGNAGDFNAEALKTIADLNGGYYSEGNPSTIARLMADLQIEF